MKILILMTQFYQLGGAELLDVELAEELNKRGIYTEIMSMYNESLPGVRLAQTVLYDRGIPAIHFLGLPIHPNVFDAFFAIFKLRKFIIENKIDIIETSMVPTTFLATWATLSSPVRHIAGIHQVFKKTRENTILHKLWRFSVRCNSKNIYYAISKYVFDAWIKYSSISASHIQIIYNSVREEFYNTHSDKKNICSELNIPEKSNLVIYVGRLAEYKGIDTIIESLGDILQRYNIYLLYIGLPDLYVEGTREMLDLISKRIDENNWCNRVQFLGYRNDIPRIMASSDVLVHPTRIEGFGLTLAEAMASGLQIVASNVEGIPEVVAGTDSILVSPNDPVSLRNGVISVLNRSDLQKNVAILKGKKCAEKYRLKNRVDKIIDMFQNK